MKRAMGFRVSSFCMISRESENRGNTGNEEGKGKGLNRISSEDLGYPLLVSFSLSISLSRESDPVPSNFSFPSTSYLPGNTKMLWKAAALAAVVGK